MTFAILGPLEVRRDGEPVEIAGQRLRTLLGLLVLDAGSTVSFDRLIAGVWADHAPDAVGNALQALVSRLRSALGKNQARQLIVADTTGYRLVAGPDQVDAHRFAVLARAGQAALASGDVRTAAARLREALALWRGPALAGLAGADVAGAGVAGLDNLRLAATEDRVDADLRLGRHAEVLAELPGLLADHPLRERLHGQHMKALYGAGRRVEALAAYETARRTFRDELGADPSPELAGLHLAMLRGEYGAPVSRGEHGAPVSRGEYGAPVSRGEQGAPTSWGEPAAPARRGNLRARLTSFVGREEDVARAGELLSAHRLVTLLGPGGAGKTRLAVESAEALAANMPDGVWLADLASVAPTAPAAPVADDADLAGVAQSVAAALDVRDGLPASPQGPLDRLAGRLRGKRLLIVLDNCEHVIEPAARLADRLLADCPDVRILATSREPLGITGEITWALRPLGLPPAGTPPAEAAAYPAVRLFADRAAAVRPGYRAADEVETVVAICRALDGLPLAIELAAARLRSLSAGQIAGRLGNGFQLLKGSRTAQPRHQTLRAVVEWSWELLDEQERVLGRRLAVFSGGATLESVERVCGNVLDPLARLVDKSLVVFDAGRYRMLETIRAYAAERLADSGEEDVVRHAHARHYTELAESAEPGLRTGDQLERLAELTPEHENLSAALRWAAGNGEGELALRLVGALGWYWWLRGHRLDGALRSRDVLAAAPGAPGSLRALGLAVHTINAVGAGWPWEDTRAALEEMRRLRGPAETAHPLVALATPMLMLFGADQPGDEGLARDMLRHRDPWVVAAGRMFGGLLHYTEGRIAEGELDTLAALDGYRSTGDRWGIGTTLGMLSDVHLLRGEAERAVEVMREALGRMDALGADEETAYIRARLAFALNLLGRRAEADLLLREIHRTAAAAGDLMGQAGVVATWGEFARQDGDLATAHRRYAEALSLMGEMVDVPPQMVSAVNSSLGLLAVQEGDLPRAREVLAGAVGQAVESRDVQLIAITVIACAGVALAAGRPAEGAALLGGTQTIKGIAAVVDFDHVRITAGIRAALGEADFHRHFDRGRALSRDELLTLALHL